VRANCGETNFAMRSCHVSGVVDSVEKAMRAPDSDVKSLRGIVRASWRRVVSGACGRHIKIRVRGVLSGVSGESLIMTHGEILQFGM